MYATQTDGGSETTQEQKLRQLAAALNALNEARRRGMPESEYTSALDSLKARYQTQVQMAGRGDPFVQGLLGATQAQPVTVAMANRDSYQGQPSGFEQGLDAGTLKEATPPAPVTAPPAAAPATAPLTETEKLETVLADMRARNAPYEAIQQAQNALEKQKLTDTIAQMQEKNAPYEAIQAAQRELDKLQNQYAEPPAPAAAPEATPPTETEKLETVLADMKARNAPYEAIQQVQNALEKQKLTDTIAQMQEKNAPHEAIQAAQRELDKLQNQYAEPPAPAAAPEATPPTETEKLETVLADMKARNAPYEAIQQVQNALEKQKLTDTIAQMQAKNAPFEAIQSAQRELDKLQNPYIVKPAPTAGEFYRNQDDILYQKYQADCDAIRNNPQLPDFAKSSQIAGLSQDTRYAGMLARRGNQQLLDDNAKKLQETIDQIKAIDNQIKSMPVNAATLDRVAELKDEKDKLIKGFGLGAQDLDWDTIDPSDAVDIKVNGKSISGARYENGFATANMEDVVKAFGGSMEWDSVHESADIRDADGKFITSIKIVNGQAWEVDMRGKPIRQFAMSGSAPQADIVTMGDMLGVPVSYYHDKNGAFHAYAQPEMRGQPVQVVRRENQVYIDVYAHFNSVGPEPNPNDPDYQIKLDKYKASVKEAYDAILSTWNTAPTGKYYELCGTNAAGDSDKVQVHATVHADSTYGQSFGGGIPAGQKATIINLDENAWLKNHGYTSHVLTVDPKDPAFILGLSSVVGDLTSNPALSLSSRLASWAVTGSPETEVQRNIDEALATGEYEKAMYNWKMSDSGQMWLYSPSDVGHECMHLLGLGDAYSAIYRLYMEAGETFDLENEYGNKATYSVPKAGVDAKRVRSPKGLPPCASRTSMATSIKKGHL